MTSDTNTKPPRHRVYLRWPAQRVSDRTVTDCPDVAAKAFQLLRERSDLAGQPVAVAWTLGGQQQAYHDFQNPLGSIAKARSRLDGERKPAGEGAAD